MTDWPMRVVELAGSPFERGLWCGPDGLLLSGEPLLEKNGGSFAPRPLSDLQGAFDRAYGKDARPDAADYLSGLSGIARSLNRGDLPLAMIGSLMLKLPDIRAGADFKQAYSDTEPRNDLGEWTDGSATAFGQSASEGPVRVADNSGGHDGQGISSSAPSSPPTVGPSNVGQYKPTDVLPSDAVQYHAPDGTSFYAPPTADFQAVHDYGVLISHLPFKEKEDAIRAAVGQGGIYDFQRSGSLVYKNYISAANYAAGVLMHGAGYSLPATIGAGGIYAMGHSKQGWTLTQTSWWIRGWVAAQRDELPSHPRWSGTQTDK